MRVLPLRISGQVVLNGSGAGTIEFTVDVSLWFLQVAAVRVDPRPVILEPECSIYVDGTFVGGSQAASLDSDTTFNQSVEQQRIVKAVWTGGDAGSVASISFTGTKTVDP